MIALFSINTPNIIYEIIDEEVIIINMERGIYYSLRGVGMDIWELLKNPISEALVTAILILKYEANSPDIEHAVSQFFSELQTEELIKPIQISHLEQEAHKNFLPNEQRNKTNFQAPILEKYTELQEMLLLDPIHSVDNTGWPVPAAHPDIQ